MIEQTGKKYIWGWTGWNTLLSINKIIHSSLNTDSEA